MRRYGASLEGDAAVFTVHSAHAERIELCLFAASGTEDRVDMAREADGAWVARLPGLADGARYGFRAHGKFDPQTGHCFDASKLLADPMASALDGPWIFHPDFARHGADTARLAPKSVLRAAPPRAEVLGRAFPAGGLIYEIAVKAFSINNPAIAPTLRGTLAALAEPAALDHVAKLRMDAVELMPLVAWIDERHLPPLGLSNAWGYNPVTLCALDPRIAPGGFDDLRGVCAAMHERGVAVFLDVVFNHTGESDALGPVLSMRGLDDATWYRRSEGGYVNDTGCGNTLACDHPVVIAHVIAALRRFVEWAGVDGFRFDLGVTLARSQSGFSPDRGLLRAILDDPLLSARTLIVEPWDVGPGGYRLGEFPPPLLEWNDRCRDDIRRFFRGDPGSAGALATRLAGSSDIFRSGATRAVNFIAAHDGFTLADALSYSVKRNEANGEGNRDGSDHNYSFNNGVEGPSDDPAVLARRAHAAGAMLAALYCCRGALMLTAGDEFGRSQRGNNNAYAQDNEITWLDWQNRDTALEELVAALARWRKTSGFFTSHALFDANGQAEDARVEWLRPDGDPMNAEDWRAATAFIMRMTAAGVSEDILFDRARTRVAFFPPSE